MGVGWCEQYLREAQVTARQVCSASQRPPHQHRASLLRVTAPASPAPGQVCSTSQRPLTAKRRCGVDARGAPAGQQTCDRRHQPQDDRNGGVCVRIARVHVEEQGLYLGR